MKDIIFKDYYSLLDVKPGATIDVIKSAFRKGALQTHPDTSGDSEKYQQFVLLREAYDVLTNKKKRLEYDRLWRQHYTGDTLAHEFNDNLNNIYDEFDIKNNPFYRDEWEFFVENPEDYLNFFQSTVKIATASLLSILSGTVVPILVFGGIVAAGLITAILSLLTIVSFITTSLSTIVFLIITYTIIRKMWSVIINIKNRIVLFLSGLIVSPLKGIPRHIGKLFIHFNFTLAIIVFLYFSYNIVVMSYDFYMSKPMTTNLHLSPFMPGKINLEILVILVLFSVLLVTFFSIAINIIYEIISSALVKYPEIQYRRIVIKKVKGITHEGKSLLK